MKAFSPAPVRIRQPTFVSRLIAWSSERNSSSSDENPRHQRHVGTRQDGDAKRVGVLLEDRLDDLLRRLVQPRVDDLHASVAQRASDDLGSSIVPVETGLGDDDSHTAFHGCGV